jgi:hypothetical protein
MNAKETKARMDKLVEVRKLVAKLDREIFGLTTTLKTLQGAVQDNNTYGCTIELSEDEAAGFHGRSYEAFKQHLESVVYEGERE